MAIQSVKISDVKSNPNNPRLIKDDKFAKLVQSLKDFPEMANVRPIVVNQDFVVLGGNMRLKAMKEAGWKQVPVQVVDWTDQQQKEFIIKDNVGFGEWEWDMLANEWEAEDLEKWGLDVPGFIEEPEAEEDDFAVPDGGIETDIVVGDLFEIGEHRLLCGDSTDSDAVARLMNGQKADVALCDPPYGISAIEKNSRMKELGWKQYENDSDINTAVDSFNLAISICDKLVFWGANHYANKLPNVGGWLIWDKQDGKDTTTYSMGELAWTNILNNVQIFKHIWDGFRKDSEKGEARLHPSQKPVKLHEWVLNKVYSNLVLDLFLGSGSTMVASHQLNRKCYGMELDPKYCQVIVDRMMKLDPNLVIKRNGEVYLKSDENQTNNGVSA
jgi:DNA modification methylase